MYVVCSYLARLFLHKECTLSIHAELMILYRKAACGINRFALHLPMLRQILSYAHVFPRTIRSLCVNIMYNRDNELKKFLFLQQAALHATTKTKLGTFVGLKRF